MPSIDREQLGEWLSAYLDGELSAKQNELIERILSEDDKARQQLDALRHTASLVTSLPRHDAPESIADDVQHYIERRALIGEVDDEPVSTTPWRSPWTRVFSVAAMLGLVVTGAWFLMREGTLTPEHRSQQLAQAPRTESGLTAAMKDRISRSKKSKRAAKGVFQDLLATASVEQKLQAGMGLEAVKEHDFDNETVRLQVVVADESALDKTASRLTSYFAKQRLVNVGAGAPDRVESSHPPGEFFYIGKPGTNFSAADHERQILVRASRRQLEGMVRAAIPEADRAADILLAAGPTRVRGERQILTALDEINPAGREASTVADEEVVASAPKTDERGSLQGLLKALSIDPELLRSLEGSSADAHGSHSTPAASASPYSRKNETATGATSSAAPQEPVAPADIEKATGADGDKNGSLEFGQDRPTVTVARDDRTLASAPQSVRALREVRPAESTPTTKTRSIPPEPMPLVQRRLREIEVGRRAKTRPTVLHATERKDRPSGGFARKRTRKTKMQNVGKKARTRTAEGDDAYITLVVQVRVKAKAGETHRSNTAQRPSKLKRPPSVRSKKGTHTKKRPGPIPPSK